MWDFIFNSANLFAIIAWVILILLPRTPLALSVVMYLGVAVLCLIYAIGLIALLTGVVDPGGIVGGGNFISI